MKWKNKGKKEWEQGSESTDKKEKEGAEKKTMKSWKMYWKKKGRRKQIKNNVDKNNCAYEKE
jgi:hypothetical protein